MKTNLLDVLGYVSGIGFLVGGGVLLFLSYRDRKYPDQKKFGYRFLAIGALLVVARVMGWSWGRSMSARTQINALDTASPLCLHFEVQWRRASEFCRSTTKYE